MNQKRDRQDDDILIDKYKGEIEKISSLAMYDMDKLIDFAELLVDKKMRSVKTHQIRRFFTSVKSIQKSKEFEKKERVKLLMMRPQLANAASKQKTLKLLYDVVTIMIGKVESKDDFEYFANFFESLVAFHSAYQR